MNKTIVYIGGELPDKEASALRIMANAKALRDFGFNICLIGQRDGLSVNEIINENYEGMKAFLFSIPKSIRMWIKELVSIRDFTKIINEEQNVCAVIMYNPHSIVFERMKTFCKVRGIKLIADCTEWHTVYHLSGVKKYIKLFDITRRINVSQKKADGIIAISSYFQKFYSGYCKTLVVPPLVDLSEEKWNIQSVAQDNVTRFVYAGRMGIGKDSLNSCIHAFEMALNHGCRLDIVGVSYNEYIKQFPEDLGLLKKLSSNIVFHGLLPHNEALEYVKQATFSLLARENNRKNDSGFPTKFVESISCGTPVIASNFSDIEGYVVDNNLGIMVSSVDKITEGIQVAINMDSFQLSRLKKNCRLFKGFDYHFYIDKLGSFIESL